MIVNRLKSRQAYEARIAALELDLQGLAAQLGAYVRARSESRCRRHQLVVLCKTEGEREGE